MCNISTRRPNSTDHVILYFFVLNMPISCNEIHRIHSTVTSNIKESHSTYDGVGFHCFGDGWTFCSIYNKYMYLQKIYLSHKTENSAYGCRNSHCYIPDIYLVIYKTKETERVYQAQN